LISIWTGRGVEIDLKVAMEKIYEKHVDIFYGWSNMNIEKIFHEFLDSIVQRIEKGKKAHSKFN
jgi:hypothetical protein